MSSKMKVIGTLVLVMFFASVGLAQITTDTTHTNQWNDREYQWENFQRNIEYFNTDHKISELIQVYDGSNWINYSFKILTFDQQMRLVEEFEQFWNDGLLRWEDNSRITFSYNADNKIETTLHQNIYDGIPQNSYREIYTYGAENKVQEKIIQNFSYRWEDFVKIDYAYLEGLLVEEKTSYWDDYSWSNTSFVDNYQYNKKGLLSGKSKSRLEGEVIIPISKEEYIINKNIHLEEMTVYQWEEKKSNWVNKNKILFVNDKKGSIISSLCIKWDKNGWYNNLYTEYSSGKTINLQTPVEKEITFTINSSPLQKKAKIEFENPEKERFIVKIVSEKGDLISSCVTSSNQIKIEKNKLESGLYYVELQGNDFYTGKFSIE